MRPAVKAAAAVVVAVADKLHFLTHIGGGLNEKRLGYGFSQNHPRFCGYDTAERLIRPFHHWLKPNGRVKQIIMGGEKAGKGAAF